MTTAFVRCASDGREALHTSGIAAARQAVRKAYREAGRDVALGSIAIEKDVSGKPHGYIRGESSPLAVSISHSFPFAFATASVATDVALGADIERIRDFSPTTWKAFLTPAEKKAIARAPRAERAYLRTLSWSLKESILKALGTGLRTHPAQVDISSALAGDESSPTTFVLSGITHPLEAHHAKIGLDFVAVAIVLPAAFRYDWGNATS